MALVHVLAHPPSELVVVCRLKRLAAVTVDDPHAADGTPFTAGSRLRQKRVTTERGRGRTLPTRSRSPRDALLDASRRRHQGRVPCLDSSQAVSAPSTAAISLPASLKSPLPLSSRAEGLPYAALDAMKAGSEISIQGLHVQAPYNRISLENSRKAIERIEWACERPAPGPTRFWRRIVRRLRFLLALFLTRFGIRIDHAAGLVLGRPQDLARDRSGRRSEIA